MTENGNGRKKLEAQFYALVAIALALAANVLKDLTGVGSDHGIRQQMADTSRQQVVLLERVSEQLDQHSVFLLGIQRHNDLIRETYGYGPDKIAEEVAWRLKEEK